MMLRFTPAITPCRREYSTMKFWSILKIPTYSPFRTCRLSAPETLGKERSKETRENQFCFYRKLRIVLILITFQTGNCLISTTEFYTQLLTPMKEITIGIGNGCCSTQVTSSISTFRLERDSRRLIGTYLNMTIQQIGIRHFRKFNIRIFYSLETGEIIVCPLQGRSIIRSPLFDSCRIEKNLFAKMDSITIITLEKHITYQITSMINFWRIVIWLVLSQLKRQSYILAPHDCISRKVNKILIETEVSII